MRGQPNSEILEAGLILVVVISIASVGPASWAHSADLMREHTYQLLFAAIATGLCIFERAMRTAPKVGSQAAARGRCGRDKGRSSTSRLMLPV